MRLRGIIFEYFVPMLVENGIFFAVKVIVIEQRTLEVKHRGVDTDIVVGFPQLCFAVEFLKVQVIAVAGFSDDGTGQAVKVNPKEIVIIGEMPAYLYWAR